MVEKHVQKTLKCSVYGKMFLLEWRLKKHGLMHTEKTKKCQYLSIQILTSEEANLSPRVSQAHGLAYDKQKPLSLACSGFGKSSSNHAENLVALQVKPPHNHVFIFMLCYQEYKQNKNPTIIGPSIIYLSFFLLSFQDTFFPPRRGCPRVVTFCIQP